MKFRELPTGNSRSDKSIRGNRLAKDIRMVAEIGTWDDLVRLRRIINELEASNKLLKCDIKILDRTDALAEGMILRRRNRDGK